MSYHTKERTVEPISSVPVVSAGTPPMWFVADSTYDSEVLYARRAPGVGLRCRLLPARAVKVLNRLHRDPVVLSAHPRPPAAQLRRVLEGRAVE